MGNYSINIDDRTKSSLSDSAIVELTTASTELLSYLNRRLHYANCSRAKMISNIALLSTNTLAAKQAQITSISQASPTSQNSLEIPEIYKQFFNMMFSITNDTKYNKRKKPQANDFDTACKILDVHPNFTKKDKLDKKVEYLLKAYQTTKEKSESNAQPISTASIDDVPPSSTTIARASQEEDSESLVALASKQQLKQELHRYKPSSKAS